MTQNDGKLPVDVLIRIERDDKKLDINVVDGEVTLNGDLVMSDAAMILFQNLMPYIDNEWLDRARTKKERPLVVSATAR